MRVPTWFSRRVIAFFGILCAAAAVITTVTAWLGWVRYPEHVPVSVAVTLAAAALCGWLYFALPEKPDDSE